MRIRLLGAALLVLTEAASAHAQLPDSETPPPAVPAEVQPVEGVEAPAEAAVTHTSICSFDWATSYGPEKYWVNVDFLYWWMRGQRVPPLVTTSPAGTTFGDVGILGLDSTHLLFGDGWIDYGDDFLNGRSGYRATVGIWLRDDLAVGIEGSYFAVNSDKSFFSQASNDLGEPTLARPYISSFTLDEQAYLVALPGALAGDVTIGGTSRLWGAELNAVIDLAPYTGWRTYLLVGCRYLDLTEDLNVNDRSTILAGGALGYRGQPLGVGDRAVVLDSFDTWNHYLGAQLGVRGGFDWGPFTLDLTAKVAFGTTTQIVEARGFTAVFRQNGVNDVTRGGVLAVDTNFPRQVEDEFTVMPEALIQLSYNVATRACFHVGYDFLFWHTVARPAEQISRTLNVTSVPTSLAFQPGAGSALPMPVLRTSDFWAQGVNVGLTFRY